MARRAWAEALDLIPMDVITSQVAEHLQQFRTGDRDAAFFGLLEMDHGILPELMAAFRGEGDSRVRAFLVEMIWQHRQHSAVSYLAEALRDPAPEVWRQALDGLVTLASPESLGVLRAARTSHRDSDEFHRWIDESIEQAERELRR